MNRARQKSLAITRLLVVAGLFVALLAQAHSPFSSSTRAFVHDDSLELLLTVGREGGLQLLAGAPPDAFRIRTVEAGCLVSGEYGEKLFQVTVAGAELKPRKVTVRTDGLEFDILLEYARPPGNPLGLRALYVAQLPGGFKSSFVLQDELGTVLDSRMLAEQNDAFEVLLPAPASPPAEITKAISPAPPVPAVNVAKATANAPPARVRVSFGAFLKLGIGHILNVDAFDHLLFLLALLVGCQRLKPMLLVITGFTLAHSLTLALAALNLVTISPRLVEPAIAVSILFVAAENFRRTEKSWHRYALACGFGLIHGFGFASALRESGLGGTGSEIALPLFAFNLGVEIGQLTVAAFVLPLLLALNRWPWFARYGARMISAVVMVVAACWLWQRLA